MCEFGLVEKTTRTGTVLCRISGNRSGLLFGLFPGKRGATDVFRSKEHSFGDSIGVVVRTTRQTRAE
jgi:hypothetical protein